MIHVRAAGHGQNINTGIFAEIVNVISVRLCIMILLIEPVPVHTTFSDLGHISGSQQCQTLKQFQLKILCYSNKFKLCTYCY